MLRIEIEGRWTAKDFSDFYSSINTLYSMFALILVEEESAHEVDRVFRGVPDIYLPGSKVYRRYRMFLGAAGYASPLWHMPIEPARFSDASAFLDPDEQLKVRRCEYASPGVTDFTGLGQALGHLKDVILKCIDVCAGRRERTLKNEILEQERDAAALKNVRERLSILRELGYSESHCRQILAEVSPAVAKLESLAQRGQITHAQNIEDDG